MADATVELVVGYLPKDSDKLYEWDIPKIEEVLEENGSSLAHTMRRFWYERLSDTHEYISVQEGGTNRPLNQIWEHCKAMLDYWDGVIADEEKAMSCIGFGDIDRTGDC